MTVTQLITTELVELDQNLGSSPEDVIRHLANLPFTQEFLAVKLCRLPNTFE